jgi:hypothetical protein
VPSSRAAATPDVAARLGQGGADAQVQPQLKLNRGDPIHYEFTLVKCQHMSQPAAANGSNRITHKYPRSTGIDALTCHNDPY